MAEAEKDIRLRIEQKDSEISLANSENEKLVEEMKSMLMICKYEQYTCQALDDKSNYLELYFKQMQDYLNVGDRNFTNIKASKLHSVALLIVKLRRK